MPSTILPVFVDTNIPLYAAGSEHSLREPALEVMRLIARYQTSFVTDAEVLQEMLHRYLALRRWGPGQVVFERFATLMAGRTAAMLRRDVLLAAEAATAMPLKLSARDLINLAVMRRLGVTRVVSADRGFDPVPDVERLDPARIDEWRASVTV